MITIINYGMGNLGSVSNMLKRIGAESKIADDPDEIAKASKILLPGVGAFDEAMRRIDEKGLREVLDHKALVEKIPVLGICLGMQLLTNGSEEGKLPGLGWIAARAVAFSALTIKDLKVPHMGWNQVSISNASALSKNFNPDYRFYFVHSYHVKVENEVNSILKTHYGTDFDSGVQKDNIFGTQFHPEKSHKYGMQLLTNFSKI